MRTPVILMPIVLGGCLGLSTQQPAAPLAKPFDGRIALVAQEHAESAHGEVRKSLAKEPPWADASAPVSGIFRGLDDSGVRVLDLSRARDKLRELRARRDAMAPIPDSFTERQRTLWREGERRCDAWSRFPPEDDAPPWQVDVRFEERHLCRGQIVQAVWQDMLREAGVKIVLEVHNHKWSKFNQGFGGLIDEDGVATVARAIDIATGRTVTATKKGADNVQAALDALSGRGIESTTPRVADVPRVPGEDDGILYDQARAMLEWRKTAEPTLFSLPIPCRDMLPARLDTQPEDSPFVQAVGEAYDKLAKNRGKPKACQLEAVSDTRLLQLRRFRLTCGQDSVFAAWAPHGLVSETLKNPGGGPRGLYLWPGMDEEPADRMVREYAAGVCFEAGRRILVDGPTEKERAALKANHVIFKARQVQSPGAMFRPGTYFLEETEQIPPDTSVLGLCGTELKRIRLERRDFDAEGGPMVEISAPCEASMLFTKQLVLTPDEVLQARLQPAKKTQAKPVHGEGLALEEGNPVTVTFADQSVELSVRAEGDTGLRVMWFEDRVRQTLFFAKEGDGASAAVLWAGDLDADGAVDVHLVVSSHRAIEHHRLFLSSKARGAELVHEVAGFSTLHH